MVAEAGSVAESIAAARRYQPDLVIMDVRLPDGSGIEACREIRAELPETRVVMLTSYPDEEACSRQSWPVPAATSSSRSAPATWWQPWRPSARGESLLDPGRDREGARAGATDRDEAHDDELAQLTQQEQKILLLVAEGKTNKEIASEVFLSDKTVKNYVSSILSKLDLQRRAQAAAFVAKHRLGGGT